MKNKQISDAVLVYDRYYSNKPNTVLLTIKRVAMCSAVTLCAMMFVISEYSLPVNRVLCGVLSVLFAAAFSVMFIFVKKRFAIPAVLIISGMLIWLRWESFSDKITYFTDYICLIMDGRFINGKLLLEHSSTSLTAANPDYHSGIMLGVVLLIMLFSMITAAGMFAKPHTLPSFLTWIALWVPVFVSESFTFNWWIVPAVAVYMGAFACSVAYLEGLTLKTGKGGSYSNAVALNERSFMNRLANSPYIKRVEMKSAYYSKYFSLTMYAAAIFAVIGIGTSTIMRNSQGIDYTKVYEFVKSLGERRFDPPFENNGAMDGYFTTPFKETSNLTISSPGTSNREIIKVTNPGKMSVYLRGEYGTNLVGDQWETPVNHEPYLWSSSEVLKRDYRPAEMRVLQSILRRESSEDDTVESIGITIDYLCSTNVVFLPAYTEDYTFYDNKTFEIYGDYVTRVNQYFGNIDKVECTALVPKFSNQDGDVSYIDLEYLRKSISAVDKWDFNSVMNSFLSEYEIIDEYRRYIKGTFLTMPDEKRKFMDGFLLSSGLQDGIDDIRWDSMISELEKNYRIADLICTYLADNYTYSLDTDNDDGDGIENFLTRTKSGHCALYASAMTLMMRSLGIPARYCTGFIAPPNGGIATILRSRNLHAWCEVYLDELGWVTFDPTSSSLFSPNDNSSDNSESDSPSSEDTSSEDSSGSSSKSSDSSSSESTESSSDRDPQSDSGDERDSGDISYAEQEKDKINIFPYILVILIIAAAAALVLIVVHGYNALGKRARKSLRRYCRERNAGMILDKIIALLEVGGLTPQNGELPEQFYRRAEKTLRCAFSTNKDMLEAVAFGTKTFHETECEGLARLLEQLYNALEAKMYFFDKIKLRRTIL